MIGILPTWEEIAPVRAEVLVTTTNATPTAVQLVPGGSLPIADGTIVWLVSRVVGRDRAGVERVVHFQSAMVYRQGGAAVLGAAGVSTWHYDSTTGTLRAVLGVSGNTATLTVTGKAATTMDWRVMVEYGVAQSAA